MIRNKSIFSIVIILVFLIADNLEVKNWIAGDYYLRATIIALAPVLLAIGSLLLFHSPKNIFKSMGIDKGFWKGLGWAFLFTLPMLIGYASLGEFNAEISYKKFYWMVILAPLAEELFFRGFLFGQLFRFGGWGFIPAGLLSALIFGSMHLYQADDFGSAVGVFMMTGMGGMWFAWLYIEWGKNLWLSIFLHFFMNAYWGVFAIADNAAGGFNANVFRTITIVATIVVTIYFQKRNGTKTISSQNLWRSKAIDSRSSRDVNFAV